MGDHSDDDQQPNEPSPRKTGRGIAKLNNIVVRHGLGNAGPIPVQFDDNCSPIGATGAALVTYIGITVRRRISILIDNWKLIKQEDKQEWLAEIREVFDFPNTKEVHHYVYRTMSKIWRNFKTGLTKDYITKKTKSGTPCNIYNNIDPETWNEFVKKRKDSKFQELSKKNRERQAKNIYKHTMSRGGYKGVEKKLIKRKVVEMEEAKRLNPAIIVKPPSRFPRQIKWVEGRKNKEGQFICPEVEEVADRINELEEQATQGSFTPLGRQDILATAIGKRDRSGRVVGEPGEIGHKRYWGPMPRASSSSKEFQMDMMDKIRAEVEAPLLKQIAILQAQIDALTRLLGARSLNLASDVQENNGRVIVNGKNSNVTKPLQPTPPDHGEDGDECYLHLDDPSFRKVAKGIQFPKATCLHHRDIQEDQVKVSISNVEGGEEGTSVPFPDDEVAVLRDAGRSFILWPKRLVFKTPQKVPNRTIPQKKAPNASKRQKKSQDFEEVHQVSQENVSKGVVVDNLSVLHNNQSDGLELRWFLMCHHTSGRPDYKFPLDGNDVLQFLTMQELD